MDNKGNAARVGAFVVGAIVLAIGALAFFGGGHFFQRKVRVVCYFPGSVNGLVAGAAVKFRGVPIGSVFDLRVRYLQQPGDRRLPVFLEIRMKQVRQLGGPADLPAKTLRALVDGGLRARLETESLVTGKLYVDLDFHPGTEVALAEVAQHGPYPEIPTLPSKAEELGETVRALAKQIRNADLPGVTRAMRGTLNDVSDLVTGGATRALAAVPPALSSIGRAADGVREQVAPVGSSARAIEGDVRRTLADARTLLSPEGSAGVHMEKALESADQAARSLRELADFLQRNPNALLVGKKQ